MKKKQSQREKTGQDGVEWRQRTEGGIVEESKREREVEIEWQGKETWTAELAVPWGRESEREKG